MHARRARAPFGPPASARIRWARWARGARACRTPAPARCCCPPAPAPVCLRRCSDRMRPAAQAQRRPSSDLCVRRALEAEQPRCSRSLCARLGGQGEHRRRALGTSPSLGGLNPAGGIRTHMEFERTCPSISNPTETEVAELVGSTAGMAGPQARWSWRGSPVNARRVSRGYGDAVGEGAPRRNGGHDHVVLRSRGKSLFPPRWKARKTMSCCPR